MAALTPVDPAVYNIANAKRPCFLRKRMIAQGSDPALSGMFPKDGQFIDTPMGISPKWTTDTEQGQTI